MRSARSVEREVAGYWCFFGGFGVGFGRLGGSFVACLRRLLLRWLNVSLIVLDLLGVVRFRRFGGFLEKFGPNL